MISVKSYLQENGIYLGGDLDMKVLMRDKVRKGTGGFFGRIRSAAVKEPESIEDDRYGFEIGRAHV